MAIKRPLVIGANGKMQQLQTGDTITVPNLGTDLINMTNGSGGSIPIGSVVYVSAANTVDLAQANAGPTSDVFGLVYDPSIANAAIGQIAINGLISASTVQWDALTGNVGGLTPGATYFLDPTSAGDMTTTAPTTLGQYVVILGTAISTTDFLIDIQQEILL